VGSLVDSINAARGIGDKPGGNALMGLADEYFHFSTMAPPFDVIYKSICEVEGTEVPMTMKHDPELPVDPQHVDKPGGMCLAGDSLELRASGQRYLRIGISLDGHTICLVGNALGLLTSSGIALTKLGGTAGRPTQLGTEGRR
jgi:hypothetical protein